MEPGTLPPTSAAEMYHTLRVYYHIMYWKGKCANMKQDEWDWIVDSTCRMGNARY